MLNFLTSEKINQVIAPGLLFWRKEKRLILRRLSARGRRWMLLPETAFVVGLIIFGIYMTDHLGMQPGQPAMASVNGMIQDGVPSAETRHRQKGIQQRLRDKPHEMLQINADDVVGALGYSDLKRIEGEMTVLQFRGESCILDLYLSNGMISPVSYEFRNRQIAGTATAQARTEIHPQSCIDDILKSHHI